MKAMAKTKASTMWRAAAMMAAGVGLAAPLAVAQTGAYPKLPVDQYLMERGAEIALARSAAPASISRDATVLVLGRQGYETAVQGTNGFVCFVGRGWTGMFDWPEFWNPKVKAADCMNPEAARSILPIMRLRARMVMAGRTETEVLAALKAAYAKKQLPALESGAMDYMMSKTSYLTDQGGHDMPHLMFYTPLKDGKDWGAGAEGSPVMSVSYWFLSPAALQAKGLPAVLVSLVPVAEWSDGTAAEHHD